MLANSRAALAALACAMLAASAHGASIVACSDSQCSVRQVVAATVKTDGSCATTDMAGYGYQCSASSCTLFVGSPQGGACATAAGTLPVNVVTAITAGGFFLYEDLSGAIVGGIIGALALIALIATFYFHRTKTGPFAEGQTWVGFLTCKAAKTSVVVGAPSNVFVK